jgi:hypothetical protein
MKPTTYILTFIYCGQIRQLFRSTNVGLVQYELQKRKKLPEYKGGKLQLRTEIGLKLKPIL